jgi:hypothetical protein
MLLERSIEYRSRTDPANLQNRESKPGLFRFLGPVLRPLARIDERTAVRLISCSISLQRVKQVVDDSFQGVLLQRLQSAEDPAGGVVTNDKRD